MTRIVASTGTATSTPVIPASEPPTSTARKTRTGGTLMVWACMRGVRILPSSCWITRNRIPVRAAVVGEIENATRAPGSRRATLRDRG